LTYFIGSDSTGFYTKRTSIKGSGFTHQIQKFNKTSLDTAYSKDLDIKGSEKVIKTFLKNKRLMVFTSKFIKSEKNTSILLREYNPTTGYSIDSSRILATYTCNLKEDCIFNIEFSPDDLKMAVIIGLNQEGMVQLSATIYDAVSLKRIGQIKTITSSEKLSERKPEYSYHASTYNNVASKSTNFKLKNNGTLIYIFNNVIDYYHGNIAFAYIPIESKDVQIKTINLKQLNIHNCAFDFVDENIFISGIFKDIRTKQDKKERETDNIGVYSVIVNPETMEIKNQIFEHFPVDVVEKLTYSDSEGKTVHRKYYFPKSILTINNALYLIETHISTNFSSNIPIAYDREFIISKLSREGKIEWIKVIPKFTTNALNGYNYVIRNNKVYLFYAEKPENLKNGNVDKYDQNKYDYIYHYNNSILVCTTFDENGILNRSEVPESKNWFYEPTASNILFEKDNGLIIKMLNNAEERYDSITITEQ
jgi:hypothetical protein